MSRPPGARAFPAARSLALDVLAVEASAALQAAGIESVLLKGPAMAYWLYPDRPSDRTYTDVDLLVAPSNFAAAGVALAGQGFQNPKAGLRSREVDRLHEQSWVREGPLPGAIDLHRGFHGVSDWSVWWNVLRDSAVSLPLLHSDVLIPDAASIALISALHASEPGPAGPVGKPARDLARACERFDEQVWRSAARRAEVVGAVNTMALGLRLDRRGEEIAERLGLPTELSPADEMQTLLLAQGKAMQDARGRGARHLAALAAVGGWRERVILALDVLIPSPAALRVAEPLADRGPAGLALAYPLRLLRLTGRLPVAVQVWFTANIRARRSGWAPAEAKRRPRRWWMAGRLWWLADRGALGVVAWAVVAVWWTRIQLRAGKLERLRLPVPPRQEAPAAERALHGVLRRLSASCLESAVVRQAWLAGRGDPRDLVIGVRSPAEGFRAHAWLEGDPPDSVGFEELLRRPWSGREARRAR